MMITLMFIIIILLMTFSQMLLQSYYLVHKLQQLGYFNLKYIKWLEGNKYREILLWDIFELLLPTLVIYVLYSTIDILNIAVYKYISASIIFLTFSWKIAHPFLSGWIGPKAVNKKPLVFTRRVIRLFFTFIVLNLIMLAFVSGFLLTPFDEFTLSGWNFFKFNAFVLMASIISPVLVLLANIVNIPVEKAVHLFFFRKAKKKLANTDIKKIAVTGSYGKTSSKFFLATLLGEKYKTLFTPASFNTPMGISRIINDEQLGNYSHFVIEMGADHKGDIDVLCDLAKPDYGIITAIDIQHLETFVSVENIIETKLSLFNHIAEGGFGIYNYDSELLRENMRGRHFAMPVFSYSIFEKNYSDVNIIAKNMRHTRKGLEFTAKFITGESIDIKTELLGIHNVSNLLGCVLAAKLLGLSINEIKRGIQNIKPVEHRLQLIDPGSGVLVLDDAFNSNLKGAVEALRVLKEIEGNKKIIVTPGIIDLGEKEEEVNFNFGKYISQFADIAILVGKNRTKKIHEGLSEKKFVNDNIRIVNSLIEAQGILKEVVVSGDVILFENDLPDTFSE
jgi:UDP-N-acetylmuramoyl-tripeptide--D-alanyl-D-alanine ligase